MDKIVPSSEMSCIAMTAVSQARLAASEVPLPIPEEDIGKLGGVSRRLELGNAGPNERDPDLAALALG